MTVTKPTEKSMLDWQYRTLLAELSHVTLHSSDESCPCNQVDLDPPEYCLAKHLLNVSSLASETSLMDSPNRDLLEQLSSEALERHGEAKRIYCKGGEWPDLAEWSRSWRKNLEPLYYTCSAEVKDIMPVMDGAALDKLAADIKAGHHKAAEDIASVEDIASAIGTGIIVDWLAKKIKGGEKMEDVSMEQKTTKLDHIERIVKHELCLGRLKRTDEAIASYARLLYKESLPELERSSQKTFGEAYDREKEVTIAIYQGIGKPVPIYLKTGVEMTDKVISWESEACIKFSDFYPIYVYGTLPLKYMTPESHSKLETAIYEIRSKYPLKEEAKMTQDPILAEVTHQICSVPTYLASEAAMEVRGYKTIPKRIMVWKATIEKEYRDAAEFHPDSIRVVKPKKNILTYIGCPLSEGWNPPNQCTSQQVIKTIVPRTKKYLADLDRIERLHPEVKIIYHKMEGIEARAPDGELERIKAALEKAEVVKT